MIRAVIPLVLVAAGLLAVVAGGIVLRSFGPGTGSAGCSRRPARSAWPTHSRSRPSGRPRYVRVEGRIDAESEFEDADHRPLVLRRTRLEARVRSELGRVRGSREAVPFDVREGLDSIAIDGAAIGDGLVVVPADLARRRRRPADRVPAGVPPETPVRAVIEQVSSVEHAIVLGVPPARRRRRRRAADGRGARPAARPHDARAGRGDADPRRRSQPGHASPRRCCSAGWGPSAVGLVWAVVGAVLGAGVAGRARGIAVAGKRR